MDVIMDTKNPSGIITQDDIDTISDLFLDISDSLTEVITPEEEGRYGNSQLGELIYYIWSWTKTRSSMAKNI